MRKTRAVAKSMLLLALGTLASTSVALASEAGTVFEKLKTLEGTWRSTAPEESPDEKTVSEFRVSAAGSVVMETMFKGTEHEMINMFYMVGDDLMITHYCAGKNQPMMKLVRGAEAGPIRFEFAGGTNFDPAVDDHIHEAEIAFVDADTLESRWTSYSGGKQAGEMAFTLERLKK